MFEYSPHPQLTLYLYGFEDFVQQKNENKPTETRYYGNKYFIYCLIKSDTEKNGKKFYLKVFKFQLILPNYVGDFFVRILRLWT